MKSKIMLLAGTLFAAFSVAAAVSHTPRWARTVELPPDFSNAAVDHQGNCFTAGGGLTALKLGSNGRQLWSVNLSNGVYARAVAVDRAGNLFVTGSQYDYAHSPTNFADIWLFKFSPHGHLLWQRQFDSFDHIVDIGTGVMIDGHGNAFVSGRSYEIDGVSASHSYNTALKYAPDGTLLWSRRHEDTTGGTLNTAGMALDEVGDLAVIADLSVVSYTAAGDLRFSWDGPARQMGGFDSAGNLLVGFPVNKLSPMGQVLWTATYTNPAHARSYALDLKVDGNGNAIVALDSPVSCVFDDGDEDCVTTPALLKYNPDGQLVWVSRFTLPPSVGAETRGLVVGKNGDAFLTARYAVGDDDHGSGFVGQCNANGWQIWSATYRPANTNFGPYFFQSPILGPNHRLLVDSELPFNNQAILLDYFVPLNSLLPRITAFSPDQTAATGANVALQVQARGPGHLQYQWAFNGATLAGATTAVLNLPAVALGQSGDYSVAVRNRAGEVTSPVTRLTVH